MKSEQHQGRQLNYITITPDDYNPANSYPLVIMLHGFGANMGDLAGLAPAIADRGYVYACPNAPFPFDFGGGQVGYGWMPRQNAAAPAEVEAARQQSETLLAGFFEEIFDHLNTAPGGAALLGFSQGGTMTYRCGLDRPYTFAALVALSAAVFDPTILKARLPATDRAQPIFIAHGSVTFCWGKLHPRHYRLIFQHPPPGSLNRRRVNIRPDKVAAQGQRRYRRCPAAYERVNDKFAGPGKPLAEVQDSLIHLAPLVKPPVAAIKSATRNHIVFQQQFGIIAAAPPVPQDRFPVTIQLPRPLEITRLRPPRHIKVERPPVFQSLLIQPRQHLRQVHHAGKGDQGASRL